MNSTVYRILFLITISLIGSVCDAQDILEQQIQQKIDAMTAQEKMAQLHRNSFWTTADNEDLNIPGFVMSDGPHGVRLVSATSFPVGIAIAASWNRELAFEVGNAMGEEFHAYGKHQQLGPALDLCRDPRNGRSPETGGEDPFLCAHINVDLVKGIQKNPVIATIKHFNGVNKQADRHNVDHNMSYRQMMEHYGYNFRRVMQDAGPLSVMNAYNLVNGEKCAENETLLTHVLRNRWGYPFYVVSDWGSVFDAEKALKAGCDLEMDVDESEFEANLQNLYNSGLITDVDLDRAVRRVLRVKYMTGMMDNAPIGNPFIGANTAEHQQLALEAGRESIVLLKNEDDLLPIMDTTATIALIGPSAMVAQLDGFGSSWVDPPYAITPYQGLANKIPEGQINYVMGCAINSTDSSEFSAARAAAAAADYVIFVGGLDPTQEGENYWPGPVDRTGGSVELPGMQQELIAALAEENPNLIVVIKSGGICAVPDVIQDIKGFLYAFYPGMEGGNAIADVIYGDYNPSGKLPVTMPVDDAQMPEWNDDFSDDFNCGYRYYDELDIVPQFAFGHGLSYTSFAYSNLQMSAITVPAGEPVIVSIDIENTGTVEGEEVVQLYMENNAALVWMPTKELKGFEKIMLQAGEMQTVTFTLTANELYYFDTDLDAYHVAPGDYVLHAGGASDALTLSSAFTVTPSSAASDLEVTRIYNVPRYPQVGDSVLFLALVKNQGTMDVLPDTQLELTFEVDGEEVSSTSIITDTIYTGGALLMTATEGVLGTAFWVPTDVGAYDITASIDSNDDLAELIETNNELNTTIEVSEIGNTLVPNLCYLKPAWASSSENVSLGPENAVDGDFNTRWSSEFSDPQHIGVDLLDLYHIDQIALVWESAYSSEYRLEVSENNVDWIEVAYEVDANGGNDLFYPDINARYIRLEGIQRATEWGHSLFEIQAFGDLVNDVTENLYHDDLPVIYPNPTSGDCTISGLPSDGPYKITVFDIRGKIVFETNTSTKNSLIIPSNSFVSGAYIIRVIGDTSQWSTKLNIL